MSGKKLGTPKAGSPKEAKATGGEPRGQDIAIKDIDVTDRLRPIDWEWVDALATNISENGQHQPIKVRTHGSRLVLIFGEHRLEAIKKLGRETIRGEIVAATVRQAKLMEIDENLIRHNLNPLDRAACLATRKEIYEEMHPEAKRGGDRKSKEYENQNDIMSFSSATAEKIGLSRKSIERAVSIHFQIDAATR